MYDTVIFENCGDIEQKLWPSHCIQDSEGSNFHPELRIQEENSLIIRKGTNPEIDSYSAFFDNCKLSKTKLDDELKKQKITDLYICGLATDVCVGIYKILTCY